MADSVERFTKIESDDDDVLVGWEQTGDGV